MVMLESETISVLYECCSNMAPVLILDPKSSLGWHARFESLASESVTFRLFEPASHSFENSNLLVSFSHYGNCCSFFSAFLEYQCNESRSFHRLTLQLPRQIIVMERRLSYRVPIGNTVVPSVRLSTAKGGTFFPKPKDLSLTGISVEFDETKDPDLSPSVELWLELHLDNHAVLLKSEIKRRDGRRYSLFFPEVITEHGVCAPMPLRKIVQSLESALLQERIHSDKPESILH